MAGGKGGGRRVRFAEEKNESMEVPARGEEEEGPWAEKRRAQRRYELASSSRARPRGKTSDDDDDDDDDDEDEVDLGGSRTQEPEELDLDEDEDEVRAMRTAVKGEEADGLEKVNEVGETIEPFNLQSERANDGFFDEAGNFVWRKQDAEPDAWVAQMDEAAVEAAIGRASKRRRRDAEDADSAAAKKKKETKPPDLRRVLVLLERGETVSAGLRRLGRRLKESRDEALPLFEELTAIADALVRSGNVDAYERRREHVFTDPRQWEYVGAADGAVHGPFTTADLLDWRAQGYFTGQAAVYLRLRQRRVSSLDDQKNGPAVTSDADDLLADLQDDDDLPDPSQQGWLHSDAVDFVTHGLPFIPIGDTGSDDDRLDDDHLDDDLDDDDAGIRARPVPQHDSDSDDNDDEDDEQAEIARELEARRRRTAIEQQQQ